MPNKTCPLYALYSPNNCRLSLEYVAGFNDLGNRVNVYRNVFETPAGPIIDYVISVTKLSQEKN